MEKFNLKKHWNKLINNELVVNCPTQKLANEFHDYCNERNITWSGGSVRDNYWSNEDTCYRYQYYFTFADIKYYENKNYIIVEFQGFNIEQSPKYAIKDVVNVKLITNDTNETVLEINRPISEIDFENKSIDLTQNELKTLVNNLSIPRETTKENIEVIYHGKETIVLIKDGKHYYKGVAKCHYEDTYDKEQGFLVAYQRARENQQN